MELNIFISRFEEEERMKKYLQAQRARGLEKVGDDGVVLRSVWTRT